MRPVSKRRAHESRDTRRSGRVFDDRTSGRQPSICCGSLMSARAMRSFMLRWGLPSSFATTRADPAGTTWWSSTECRRRIEDRPAGGDDAVLAILDHRSCLSSTMSLRCGWKWSTCPIGSMIRPVRSPQN
jgi:hypothetical protein